MDINKEYCKWEMQLFRGLIIGIKYSRKPFEG